MKKTKLYRMICSRFEKLGQSLLQHFRFCCIVFTDFIGTYPPSPPSCEEGGNEDRFCED